MKRWRCYLIGFNEPWSKANKSLCEQLIKDSDFSAVCPHGLKVGEQFSTKVLFESIDTDARGIPERLVCIGHEHQGKIAIVQERPHSVE